MNFKAGLFSAMGVPVSGAVDLTMRVQRDADYWFLDWNDGIFYAPAHVFVTIDRAMAEPDAVHAPGWYMYNVPDATLATWNPGLYTIYMNNAGALAPPPWHDITEIRLPDALGVAMVSNQGLAQSGGLSTIQLVATASVSNNYYTGQIVFIKSGLGAGQARIITNYVGIGTTATVYPNWVTNPDNTSIYVILPLGSIMVNAVDPVLQAAVLGLIGASVLDADLQLHLGAGVGFRNIGNILGALAQSEFEQRTNVFSAGAVVAQGITAPGWIQYQQVDLSYTKNWAAPDRTYYLLYHYNAQRQNDIVKASLLPVW
jgi:hypothetical protein